MRGKEREGDTHTQRERERDKGQLPNNLYCMCVPSSISMQTPMHECLEWQHVHRVGEARAHQTTPMTAAIAMTTMTITTITTPAAIPPDEPGKGGGARGWEWSQNGSKG